MDRAGRARVLRRRLATQRLTAAPLPTATDAVRLLTCVQSQERDHGFWSLGQRSRATTYAAVRAEHDAGAFVRTHILRPTWHFVAAEDVRWILELTSSRVKQSMAPYRRKFGLDAAAVDRGRGVVEKVLAGRNTLNRNEIGRHLAEAGLPGRGEAVGHLLMALELDGVICGGPIAGVQHTYGLLDELVTPTTARSRDEALAELAHRFFAGHGPAALKDLTRWASLTVADATAAVASLRDVLEQVDVEGVPHWADPTVPSRTTLARRAHLLPAYDEVTLSYPGVTFPVAPAASSSSSSGEDPWYAVVLVDETVVGTWRRTVTRAGVGGSRHGVVTVETRLTPALTADQHQLVEEAVRRLGDFLGLAARQVIAR